MRGETTVHFGADHPAFAGHFPGRPIVPGVLLLDAAVHAAQQALRPAGPGDAAAPACEIGSAKFLSPVGPGEMLTISLDTTATGAVRFEISSGSRKVATGTLVLSPAP
ncbi:MAG: Beta-hydroxyacyl-(acyl-carrier-protein) dehydratase, FabA/FabZ [Ramlibacter sp.]|jgi:3-hydroxymyristoyl/3-hydroxydecanoyl-(acyl carrier protein) dehydratase|nr:Beta-hydroxyacyl-(acyl-carrier-protein) dehydratase, FabA/FabZ [Ramlibacter sp.]